MIIINGQTYKEIVITNDKGEVLASITPENIIENENCKIKFIPETNLKNRYIKFDDKDQMLERIDRLEYFQCKDHSAAKLVPDLLIRIETLEFKMRHLEHDYQNRTGKGLL